MTDFYLATVEAHALLQISKKNRDDEWEDDRGDWLDRWEEAIFDTPPNQEDSADKCTHPTGYIKSVRICGLCGEQL